MIPSTYQNDGGLIPTLQPLHVKVSAGWILTPKLMMMNIKGGDGSDQLCNVESATKVWIGVNSMDIVIDFEWSRRLKKQHLL